MSETEVNGNTKVTYTVKELFSELLAKMGTIEGKLDTKANAAEVATVRDEQIKQAARILVLETEKGDNRRFNALWIPVILQLVTSVVLIYATWPRK